MRTQNNRGTTNRCFIMMGEASCALNPVKGSIRVSRVSERVPRSRTSPQRLFRRDAETPARSCGKSSGDIHPLFTPRCSSAINHAPATQCSRKPAFHGAQAPNAISLVSRARQQRKARMLPAPSVISSGVEGPRHEGLKVASLGIPRLRSGTTF